MHLKPLTFSLFVAMLTGSSAGAPLPRATQYTLHEEASTERGFPVFNPKNLPIAQRGYLETRGYPWYDEKGEYIPVQRRKFPALPESVKETAGGVRKREVGGEGKLRKREEVGKVEVTREEGKRQVPFGPRPVPVYAYKRGCCGCGGRRCK